MKKPGSHPRLFFKTAWAYSPTGPRRARGLSRGRAAGAAGGGAGRAGQSLLVRQQQNHRKRNILAISRILAQSGCLSKPALVQNHSSNSSPPRLFRSRISLIEDTVFMSSSEVAWGYFESRFRLKLCRSLAWSSGMQSSAPILTMTTLGSSAKTLNTSYS